MHRLFDVLALIFWLFLAGVRLAQVNLQAGQFNPLAWLLTLQAGLVAYALVARRPESSLVPIHQKLVAWLSALLPFLLQVSAQPGWIQMGVSVSGLLLAVWGISTLGPAFGVAPADRGLVLHGPYRFLRHPIYAGELLAILGACFGACSAWNLFVLAILSGSVLVRICWEERAIDGYQNYARQVRWRLVPGVW